jgi:hypothetical protein
MPAGQCQLQTPPRLELTANIGQVGSGILAYYSNLQCLQVVSHLGCHFDPGRPVACSTPAALAHDQSRLRERGRGDYFYPTRKACFVRSLNRDYDPPHVTPGESRHHRQQTGDGTQLTAQGKLTQDSPATARPHLFGPHQDAQRYRQIQGGAAFAHVRRRQVDRYPSRRVLVAAVPDGAPDSLASLLQGRVCQPDDGEAGQARGDVHLDPNRASVQALEGCREK